MIVPTEILEHIIEYVGDPCLAFSLKLDFTGKKIIREQLLKQCVEELSLYSMTDVRSREKTLMNLCKALSKPKLTALITEHWHITAFATFSDIEKQILIYLIVYMEQFDEFFEFAPYVDFPEWLLYCLSRSLKTHFEDASIPNNYCRFLKWIAYENYLSIVDLSFTRYMLVKEIEFDSESRRKIWLPSCYLEMILERNREGNPKMLFDTGDKLIKQLPIIEKYIKQHGRCHDEARATHMLVKRFPRLLLYKPVVDFVRVLGAEEMNRSMYQDFRNMLIQAQENVNAKLYGLFAT